MIDAQQILIRNTRAEDFPGIVGLTREVYSGLPPWTEAQLECHLRVFPEGQFVAIDSASGVVVGMAASLIILWDDYETEMSWRDFTESGMFTNHDPEHGRTLYGAEVMVQPAMRGRGIGKGLYRKRRELVERLGLLRIRAGARLAGYHRYAESLSPEKYVIRVVNGEIGDPTLSFQLGQGFHVLAVVKNYLRYDPASLGYAAVIEWLNSKVAEPGDYAALPSRFRNAPRAAEVP
jgi:ribosomal protein S18 acetylase RimI-like enzyme